MKKLTYYLVDAFTNEINKGNRAGVILDASNLTDSQMQEIAKEINVSESAFVTKIEDGTVSIRYFSIKQEVPICGHATVATFHTLLKNNSLSPGLYKLDCLKGKVDIILSSDGYVGMIVDKIELIANIDKHKQRILEGLNLDKNDLVKDASINIYSTGNPKVIIEVKNEEILDSITINEEILIELTKEINCSGYHVITQSKEEGILIASRMFAPSIGIKEDPVTGNSVGCIIKYLFDYSNIKITDLMSCVLKQGQAINKTGYIEVNTIFNGNEIKEITYYGDSIIVEEKLTEIDE